MKSILLLLLAIPYVLGVETTAAVDDRRRCIAGRARADFADGVPVSFKARGRIHECPTADFGCGMVRKFGTSRELNHDRSDVEPNSINHVYKTINMDCVPPTVCERIVGGTNGIGCAYTDYAWARYEPRSCNATRDFDSKIFRQNVRLVYACCNSDDCFTQIQANGDSITRTTVETQCTQNTKLGEYIEALHTCWNKKRAVWREHFRCDPDGEDIFDFREVCKDDVYGEYDRTLAERTGLDGEECRWRVTCSEDLQKLIELFGECACDAAKTNGFTGEAIGALMEDYWNGFCPQVEISCAGENMGLFVRRRRRRRRIKFKINKAKTYIEGKIAAWKIKIAAYLRIRSEDADAVIDITIDDSDATVRRLLVEELESTVNIDVNVDDVMNDAINDDACNESGLRTTLEEAALEKISCEYSDVEDMLVGSDGSTTKSPATTDQPEGAPSMVAFGVIIGVLGYLFE